MTWLLGIKIYATACLLFTAAYATWGYRRNRCRERDEARREYRWHMSPIYLHEPLAVIKAEDR